MNKKTIRRCIKFALSKVEDHPYYIILKGKKKRSKFLHFAFIIQGNTIVSWGWNHAGEAPEGYGYFGTTIHAEVDAYQKAKDKLSGKFEVFNIRFNKRNEMNLSMPCSCCTEFLRVCGCKVAYFTTGNGVASIKL